MQCTIFIKSSQRLFLADDGVIVSAVKNLKMKLIKYQTAKVGRILASPDEPLPKLNVGMMLENYSFI